MRCPNCNNELIQVFFTEKYVCLDCGYVEIDNPLLFKEESCEGQLGDNFPLIFDDTKLKYINHQNKLVKSRKKLVKELATIYESKLITLDDIIDQQIELNNYNKNKRRIK